MRTGIATVSISGNLSDKIAAIAAAGFNGIEIFEQDFLADPSPPREVGERVRDAGLEILLFQPFRDFEGLPEPSAAAAVPPMPPRVAVEGTAFIEFASQGEAAEGLEGLLGTLGFDPAGRHVAKARRGGRVLPGLFARLRGRRVLRDPGAARRLCGVWRGQRAVPHRSAKAAACGAGLNCVLPRTGRVLPSRRLRRRRNLAMPVHFIASHFSDGRCR